MKVNPAQSAEISTTTNVEAPEQNIEVFNQTPYSDIDQENYIMSQNTKKRVINTLKKNKENFELHQPWIGKDYILVKGDGKMTYGQLREQLGIPPKVLSKTNNKRLQDDQVVKDGTRINLEDIGYFEMRMDEMEATDARAQRNHGNPFGGYDRAMTNSDIIDALK